MGVADVGMTSPSIALIYNAQHVDENLAKHVLKEQQSFFSSEELNHGV